jgi:DNA-directed RNA polymerase specialized sigma24 family protein
VVEGGIIIFEINLELLHKAVKQAMSRRRYLYDHDDYFQELVIHFIMKRTTVNEHIAKQLRKPGYFFQSAKNKMIDIHRTEQKLYETKVCPTYYYKDPDVE